MASLPSDPNPLLGRYVDTEYGMIAEVTQRTVGRHAVLVFRVIDGDGKPAAIRPVELAKSLHRGELVFAPDATHTGQP